MGVRSTRRAVLFFTPRCAPPRTWRANAGFVSRPGVVSRARYGALCQHSMRARALRAILGNVLGRQS
eukprot:11211115-Lingulodinium_polyedra.AAC.1